MADVELIIDGTAFGGWESIGVNRSIETISGAFDLAVTEKSPFDPTDRRIRTGAPCSVAVDGETVITGYVDEIDVSENATTSSVTIRGRDRAADLVDCAAVHKPAEWLKRTLDAIARDICAPFGISVSVSTDVGKPFPRFSINQGEKAFAAIERMCRQRAVLPVSNGRGGIELTRAGTGRAAGSLVRGDNVIGASGQNSDRGRFSEIIVRGDNELQPGWKPEAGTEPENRATLPTLPSGHAGKPRRGPAARPPRASPWRDGGAQAASCGGPTGWCASSIPYSASTATC